MIALLARICPLVLLHLEHVYIYTCALKRGETMFFSNMHFLHCWSQLVSRLDEGLRNHSKTHQKTLTKIAFQKPVNPVNQGQKCLQTSGQQILFLNAV